MTTSKLAYEAAFPDGFVTSVNYVVPKELSDIAEKLEALDVEDEDAVAEVRAEIKGIEAGDLPLFPLRHYLMCDSPSSSSCQSQICRLLPAIPYLHYF